MNKCLFTGRLTADIELKKTEAEKTYARFSLAVQRNFKDKEGNRPVDFVPCVVWGQTADFIAKYAHKGDLIEVEGELRTGNYTDKEGNKRTDVSVTVTEAKPLCKKQAGDSKSEDFEEIEIDDDVPPFA